MSKDDPGGGEQVSKVSKAWASEPGDRFRLFGFLEVHHGNQQERAAGYTAKPQYDRYFATVW
jgi:hypothetical protein